MVFNHTSDRHPWFVDAAGEPGAQHRDWYIWSATNPDYVGPGGQQVWYALDNAWYYAIFWSGQPDLNYRNPAVTEEIYRVTRHWLDNMWADGFRLDAIRYLVEEGLKQQDTASTHDWLRKWLPVRLPDLMPWTSAMSMR
jgi:glycosidase